MQIQNMALILPRDIFVPTAVLNYIFNVQYIDVLSYLIYFIEDD